MKYLKLFENYNTIYKGIPVDEVKDIFTDFLDRHSIHDCEFFIQDKNELFREIICENPNLGKKEWSSSGWNPNSKDFMQTISVIIRLPESRRSEKFCDRMGKLSYNIWAGEDKIISAIIDRMLDFFDFKFVDLFTVGGTDVIFTFVKNSDWVKKTKSSGVGPAYEEVYYPDLSPHYTQKTLTKIDSPNAKEFLRINNYVNIGWLDTDHDFPKGDVDPKLVDKIKRAPVSNVTKGWHNCIFCDNKEDSWAARSSKERKIPGKNGISYCYPDMLAHYIEKHNYLPPKEFLDAVEEYTAPKEEVKKIGGLSPAEKLNLERLRRKLK